MNISYDQDALRGAPDYGCVEQRAEQSAGRPGRVLPRLANPKVCWSLLRFLFI